MNYRIVLVLLVSFAFLGVSVDAEQPKPNVILMFTDDLGWQDLKCYDIDEPSPMETPNLDAFAKKGVMFWQAYSPAPTCAPSRCAIMSGNHPARAQKTHVVGGAPPTPHNQKGSRIMDPWYSGRMPEDEFTLALALKQNGYVTGHSGKWHIAIDHHAFPQPTDVGFDYSRSDRGVQTGMKDRLSGFATDAVDDPFRLDENGYPLDQTNQDALTFLRENKDKPFFLYYATWLVHSPIQTRCKALLDKYVDKLGVDPRHTVTRETAGQLNPYYCAMVEMLDYYSGQLFDYLDETDDPRWPGHKLSENTYVIFTSDNGGMEGGPKERYTDNNPLDRGKISAKEGGTRVPLFIVGPGIQPGVQSDVMVNGLDFYPTILALTGSSKPSDKHLDGCDLSQLLLNDPTNPALVKHADGTTRDTMMWHFPHGVALESTIRIGDYKLIRNYDHVNNDGTDELELFQLYQTNGNQQQRVDIEEAKNLAAAMPEKAEAMNQKLTEILTEMNASYPSYNPDYQGDLPGKQNACTVLSHQSQGNEVAFWYQENGAKLARADLIYTLNGGDRDEEWFRKPATILQDKNLVSVKLPPATTHYVINLIDENNFLRSYPDIKKTNQSYSSQALSVTGKPKAGSQSSASIAEKDADNDGRVSQQEYINHFVGGFDRKDKNQDGVLTPSEHAHPSFTIADTDEDQRLTRAEFASIFKRQFDRMDRDKNGFITADEINR
ncbi:sulfatase-like hydrolase/transferase [Novipirellula caenicola]|uniref:EF-hand domain-containing protein n=1 Tax=Novipirellula caenicola TaxID=1536901 RepID=A0ABP9VSQ2_9BACT